MTIRSDIAELRQKMAKAGFSEKAIAAGLAKASAADPCDHAGEGHDDEDDCERCGCIACEDAW